MKDRILFLIMIAVCSIAHVQAQTVIEEVQQDSVAQTMNTTTSEPAAQGGGYFCYQGRESGFGLGYGLQFDWFNIGFSNFYQSVDPVEIEGWDIYLGISRYTWLGENLYIGANGGLAYFHSKSRYYDSFSHQYVESKGGDFGLYLMPRAGLSLFKGKNGTKHSVFVGYRWDWPNFDLKLQDNGYLILGYSFEI